MPSRKRPLPSTIGSIGWAPAIRQLRGEKMLTGNGRRQLEAQWISDDRSIASKGAAMVIRDDDDFEPPRLSPLLVVAFVCMLVVARIRAAWEDCMRR